MMNRFKWYNYPAWHKVDEFPLHVDVEISSLCDMSCPMCYTSTDLYKSRVKRTVMDFGLYKKIIDECSKYKLFSVRLSLRGEAFLNPDLVKMVRYAKDSGIKEVSTLTNGLKLDEEMFEKLVECGLDWLTISIDGWGRTYEKIRKPARFSDIYKKVKAYARIKRDKGSSKPVVKVQSVWPAIASDPGHFYSLFEPYVDEVASNPLIDFLREDRVTKLIDDFSCPYLWQRISIGADGSVLMCQCDDMQENLLGNALTDSIYDIWHGQELNRIRLLHVRGKWHHNLEPCMHCAYPRSKEKQDDVKINNRNVKIDKYVGRSDRIHIPQGVS